MKVHEIREIASKGRIEAFKNELINLGLKYGIKVDKFLKSIETTEACGNRIKIQETKS